MTIVREDAGSERDDLITALEKHRELLRQTVRGITDEEASRRTTVSELCLGGVIKHVTRVEQRWVDFIQTGPGAIGATDPAAMEAHMASFRMSSGETLGSLLDRYEEVAAHTDKAIFELPSLDVSQSLPEAPWFEPGARWSARRVIVHILAETAQHSGHADIIREALDGAKTMG